MPQVLELQDGGDTILDTDDCSIIGYTTVDTGEGAGCTLLVDASCDTRLGQTNFILETRVTDEDDSDGETVARGWGQADVESPQLPDCSRSVGVSVLLKR